MKKRKYKYVEGEFDLVYRPSAAEIDKDGTVYWNKNNVNFETKGDEELYSCKYITGAQETPEIRKTVAFVRPTWQNFLKREAYIVKATLLNTLQATLGDKQVIIGLGPGRSGSMSLSLLFSYQTEITAYHESKPSLGWYATVYEFIGKWARFFAEIQCPTPIVADVAFWYMPFVEEILYVCPRTKFVCIYRDIEQVVRSKLIKAPSTSYWTLRNSKHWNKNWNHLHIMIGSQAQYDLPKEEGCRRFVTEYYETAEKYQEKYPNSFKIFPIDHLNSKEGMAAILDFCEVKEQRTDTVIHVNRTAEIHQQVLRSYKDKFGEDF